MKNYGKALLNLMMGVCLFLHGHETIAETDAEKISVSADAKQNQAESNKSTGQKTDAPAADAGNADVFQKPLDLSIPFKMTEGSGHKSGQNAAEQDLFAARKKQRALELNGGAVMTHDPEGEKQQTVDGAGIVFSLKP
ncbi:hypothetical protein [Methylobacter sp. YRD-M1]|uniref:hypothetical protein n=1 Tax=Methylobacter sp. YRD-M1 TaxID=2911520 RepID=UPI00227B4EA7|nr:hypothetical protein [Methylobacter sp. YRD-M1]WAK03051.1 hypothetical protein LZ558_04490 [Methylobacter sp. YRD-M1]